jgi:carbon storage regulator
MLVLRRKSGEEILVPQHGITLRILEIRGDHVRIGLTAPSDVRPFRGEVWARVLQGPTVGPNHSWPVAR